MTQAATYLACAPKSNAVIVAYTMAHTDVTPRPSDSGDEAETKRRLERLRGGGA